MPSTLSRIPIPRRRQLAATFGLFAVLFLAVAAVAATGKSNTVLVTFIVIALLIAVTLALLGWGVANSVKIDLADERLDAAIDQAVAARGVQPCGCGHEHDPTELHVVGDDHATRRDDACAHDGHGVDCTHTCDTCVLAVSRPRPRPRPR